MVEVTVTSETIPNVKDGEKTIISAGNASAVDKIRQVKTQT